MNIDLKQAKGFIKSLKNGTGISGKHMLNDIKILIESQQKTIEQLENKLKCATCLTKVKGSGDFCVNKCMYNKISDLREPRLNCYLSKE